MVLAVSCRSLGAVQPAGFLVFLAGLLVLSLGSLCGLLVLSWWPLGGPGMSRLSPGSPRPVLSARRGR